MLPCIAKVDQQDALLSQLKAAGVKFIRVGVPDDSAGVDFVKRASDAGISILLLLDFRYPPNAPTRPYRPKEFPKIWSGHPLSSADPQLSKAYFQSLLGQIDKLGIKLAGLELGNEINGSAFNADFPLQADAKALGLADLETDPVGQQVAKGFVRYVAVLGALKEVRDHLSVNRATPIISAGLVGYAEDFAHTLHGGGVVFESAALSYLRAHGVDAVVDAYGVHTYPSSNAPDDPVAAERRLAHLKRYDLAECHGADRPHAKPCWITEWGFRNSDLSCPPDESARSALIRQMLPAFEQAAKQGSLEGLFWFTWTGEPGSERVDPYSVYRCNALTSSGELADKPLP